RAGFYLLSELKELRGIINDWTATFPGVGGAVEELAKFGQAEKNKASHSLPRQNIGNLDGDVSTPAFFVTDELENQLDNLDALLVSLTTKVAAYDTVDEKTGAFTFDQWIMNARPLAARALDVVLQLVDSLIDAQLFRFLASLRT
uniref:Uncharacterized protein n=1 Tax=Plectus sambesii TaxID=2011161 RepID=A0A914VRE1_9BILA